MIVAQLFKDGTPGF